MKFDDWLRRLAERSTRHWIYKRRLGATFGNAPIYVTPAAGLRFLFRGLPSVDPHLLRNARELVRRGDVVWDIGANVGLFTFAAAALAGHGGSVVAFEPDIWLAQILRRSAFIQSARSAQVTIFPVAIGAALSLRCLTIPSRSRASNALAGYGHSQMGGVSEMQATITLALDWLTESLPPPNVIKCDVEGAEVEVFAGQSKILTEIRPVTICEVSGESAAKMTVIFENASYRLFNGNVPLSQAAEIARASWNTVAIPAELTQRYLAANT